MSASPVVERILSELQELEQIIARIKEGMQKLQQTNDLLYLDSVTLNLQSFYNGIERIFESIAQDIDGHLPQGGTWHRELVSQMTQEVPEVRPAVISEHVRNELDEYRSFRHIARHIYSTKLDRARIEPLAERVDAHFGEISRELQAFVSFLRASESETDNRS